MASSSSSGAPSSSSPCAACKFLRRKCTAECVFAPYFPPDQPHKFANVHKVFGASNITKLLNELPPHKREDAVNSLAYEADARVKDPVYGCVGAISILQRQVTQLQQELAIAQSDLARLASAGSAAGMPPQLALPGHHGGGMELSPPGSSSFMQQGAGATMAVNRSSADHHRQQQQLLIQQSRLMGARDAAVEQLLEQLQRDTLVTREQLVEQLTRAGGGSLENGLAALGGINSLNTSPHIRSASDGGGPATSAGGNMGHISPKS